MTENAGTATTASRDGAQEPVKFARLGPYDIQRQLGAGGMGEVYLARDSRLRRNVAVKVLAPSMTSDKSAVERFRHEAHAVSALNHPNILTIYDIGQQDDVHFIATEFVEGRTLRERMSERPLALTETLDIAGQVAIALAAAHAAGIIHRDIKPENVMIRKDGYVKVLDFGIAKLGERGGEHSEPDTLVRAPTTPGMIIGTVRYMSPEQARGLAVDPRSDLFSLGVMIYEMTAGRLPFAGATPSDVLAAILRHEPRALTELVQNLPTEFDRLVDRALRKERAERYASAAEMLAELNEIRRALPDFLLLKRNDLRDVEAAISTRILPADGAGTASGKRARTRKAIDSLVVLPFTNASTDPETDYLADGITDSIINTLSLLPKVRIIPRSTAFRYRASDEDPMEIGRALGVRAVLTGRVLQVVDSLVFTTELIDVTNDAQVWGEQYRRELTDIFALQGEIAEEISTQLKLKLTGAQKKRLRKRYTDNTEAYQFYLKGRYFVIAKRTEEWIKKGIEYFQQAIDLDPNYALAYAGIAEAYGFLASSTGGWAPRDAYPKAKAAAEKALELDQELAEAHCSLGFARLLYDWDFPGARASFQRALKINPSYATAQDGYGFYLKAVGRHKEAIEKGKQALQLDPLSAFAHVSLSYAYYFARDYARAIAECERALEMDPRSSFAFRTIGQSKLALGDSAGAIEALERAVEFARGGTVFDSALGFVYGSIGAEEKARKILRELTEGRKHGYVSSFDLALLHLGLGQADDALAALENAYEERSGFIPFLNVEPMMDTLRHRPAFQALLRRVGFASTN